MQPSAGPREGGTESVRGQDDRKRERHAMDGVWLPADGDPSVARGFPGSRYKPRPGVKGAGPYAPLPPPLTAGGQNASVYQAEPDQATAATSSAWPIRNAAGDYRSAGSANRRL